MNKKSIADNKLTSRQTRRGVLTLLALLTAQIGLYGLMVNSSVGHVVGRISYESKAGELISKVSALESAYFALQSSLTTEMAKKQGYVASGAIQYVDADGLPITILTRAN